MLTEPGRYFAPTAEMEMLWPHLSIEQRHIVKAVTVRPRVLIEVVNEHSSE